MFTTAGLSFSASTAKSGRPLSACRRLAAPQRASAVRGRLRGRCFLAPEADGLDALSQIESDRGGRRRRGTPRRSIAHFDGRARSALMLPPSSSEWCLRSRSRRTSTSGRRGAHALDVLDAQIVQHVVEQRGLRRVQVALRLVLEDAEDVDQLLAPPPRSTATWLSIGCGDLAEMRQRLRAQADDEGREVDLRIGGGGCARRRRGRPRRRGRRRLRRRLVAVSDAPVAASPLSEKRRRSSTLNPRLSCSSSSSLLMQSSSYPGARLRIGGRGRSVRRHTRAWRAGAGCALRAADGC